MMPWPSWVWSVGCATPTTAKIDLSAGIEEAKPGDPAPKFEVVDAPPPSSSKSGARMVASPVRQLRILADPPSVFRNNNRRGTCANTTRAT